MAGRSGGLRDRHLKYLLILPAVAVVVGTAIWPLIDSLVLSFRFWKLSRSNVPGPFVGFENYAWALVEEPAFWNSVWVTGVYTVLTVGLTTGLALGVALLLAPGGRLRFTVRTLLILPFAMSPALVGSRSASCSTRVRPLRRVLRDPPSAARGHRLALRPGARLRGVRHGRRVGLGAVHDPGAHRGARRRSGRLGGGGPVDGASSWRVFRDITLRSSFRW